MNFAHAHVLWLLAIIPPVLIGFFWWAWRERQRLSQSGVVQLQLVVQHQCRPAGVDRAVVKPRLAQQRAPLPRSVAGRRGSDWHCSARHGSGSIGRGK